MSKHAPSPWVFEIASNGSARILSKDTRQLICVFPQQPGGNLGATIKLVLAAPKLLAMLEAVYEAEFGYSVWPDDREILALIKEAKGEK